MEESEPPQLWAELGDWLELESPAEFLDTVQQTLAQQDLYLREEKDELSELGSELEVFSPPSDSSELFLGVPVRKAEQSPAAYRGLLAWISERYVSLTEENVSGTMAPPRHALYDLDESFDLSVDQLQAARELESILQSFVEVIYDTFNCDVCRLFWRESEKMLRLRASRPQTDEETTLNIEEDPLIRSVIEEGKGILINDLPSDGQSERAAQGFRSFIAVPFRQEGQVFGTVNISSETKDSYTQEQLNQLSSFCDNLASVYSITQDFANLAEYIEELLIELPVGVANIRREAGEVVLNPVARELLNITDERLSLASFEDHIREELECEQLSEIVAQSTQSDLTGPTDVELHQEQEAHPTIISVIRSTVRNVDGEVSGTLMVLADVTEQRLLNRQMSRTERLTALGELASSLAHEIKTPLTSIHGFAQMVPQKIGDEEFLERMASIVQKESDRLNSLVENLLSYGRSQVAERTEVSLSPLIDDLKVLIDKKLEKKEISFRKEISKEFTVYGDEAKLKQVFLNLFLNAIDAVDSGGEVEVEAEEVESGFLQVEVRDDGKGMEEGVQQKLFNPFFTTKEEGTGLGMAIAHRIIEEHAGQIEVDSTPGEGTVISLILPAEEEATS